MLKRCSSKFINLSQVEQKEKFRKSVEENCTLIQDCFLLCLFFFKIAFPISAPRDI